MGILWEGDARVLLDKVPGLLHRSIGDTALHIELAGVARVEVALFTLVCRPPHVGSSLNLNPTRTEILEPPIKRGEADAAKGGLEDPRSALAGLGLLRSEPFAKVVIPD